MDDSYSTVMNIISAISYAECDLD